MFAKLLRVMGLTALMAVQFAAPTLAQKTKLTVYTALENDQLAPFKAEIEKAVPAVDVEWVRDSTGIITARFLAEKDNPKADMVMGLAASSCRRSSERLGVEALRPAFHSTDGSW